MKILVLTVALFFTFDYCFGQQDLKRIRASFDKATFYNDTTIKEANRTRLSKKHGYAIEFSEDGSPTAIGRYWKGKKWGWWTYRDKKSEHYNSRGYKSGEDMMPEDCMGESLRDFNRLYERLLAGEKYP